MHLTTTKLSFLVGRIFETISEGAKISTWESFYNYRAEFFSAQQKSKKQPLLKERKILSLTTFRKTWKSVEVDHRDVVVGQKVRRERRFSRTRWRKDHELVFQSQHLQVGCLGWVILKQLWLAGSCFRVPINNHEKLLEAIHSSVNYAPKSLSTSWKLNLFLWNPIFFPVAVKDPKIGLLIGHVASKWHWTCGSTKSCIGKFCQERNRIGR